MLRKWVTVAIAAIAVFLFSMGNTALAGDAAQGKMVFGTNCASCHLNGKNVVNAAKTLSKADLEKYGMFDEEAIINQVTNGKMAMPAFRGRLSAEEIENVAAYVLEQAEAGW